MREVFSHPDPTRVGLYKSILDEAGIPCFVKNEFGSRDNPAVWVMHDEDHEEAVLMLGEVLDTPSLPTPDWICSQCHAEVPGNFDSCWQCSAMPAQP
jgi:hypothetical protein